VRHGWGPVGESAATCDASLRVLWRPPVGYGKLTVYNRYGCSQFRCTDAHGCYPALHGITRLLHGTTKLSHGNIRQRMDLYGHTRLSRPRSGPACVGCHGKEGRAGPRANFPLRREVHNRPNPKVCGPELTVCPPPPMAHTAGIRRHPAAIRHCPASWLYTATAAAAQLYTATHGRTRLLPVTTRPRTAATRHYAASLGGYSALRGYHPGAPVTSRRHPALPGTTRHVTVHYSSQFGLDSR
jgi:hypothetical protein